MILRNPKFGSLYKSKARYNIVTGGRASAKSFEVGTLTTLLTFEQFHRILYSRFTMSSAEISIIPEFKDKMMRMDVEKVFNFSGNIVTNKRTNSEIIFSGIKTSSGNQTAKLKSIAGVTTFIVDEAEEFESEEDFDTIDLSIRTNIAQNRVIIIMNPSHKDHWVYKKFIRDSHKIIYIDGVPVEISTHPNVNHIHTTYLDNIKNVNKSFLDIVAQMKKDSPSLYAHKIIGQWLEVSEGAIFIKTKMKYYKIAEALEKAFESVTAYIDVADEGTDYLAMLIGKNIGSKIYIPEVVYSDSNTDVTLALCAEAINRNKVSYCRVESNSMGGMFGKQLRSLCPNCMILLVASTQNKHTRIIHDAVFVTENFVWLEEKERPPMYQNFMSDLFLYTKDKEFKRDDAPDASTGLAIFIRSLYAHLYP